MTENGNGYNGKYTAQQFIDAIPNSAGIITTIATRVGCKWHTAKVYITKYPTIAKAYADECERVKDRAEAVILKAINAEDVQTAKWYLTLKAKDRGYVQRQEVSGPDGGPVETMVRVNVGQLTDNELTALAEIAGRIGNDTAGADEA